MCDLHRYIRELLCVWQFQANMEFIILQSPFQQAQIIWQIHHIHQIHIIKFLLEFALFEEFSDKVQKFQFIFFFQLEITFIAFQ